MLHVNRGHASGHWLVLALGSRVHMAMSADVPSRHGLLHDPAGWLVCHNISASPLSIVVSKVILHTAGLSSAMLARLL